MIRLGLTAGGRDGRPVADLVGLVRAADAAGIDTAIVAESRGRDAFVLLGHLAAATSGIRLATGIVNVYSRTPASIAMAAATLDELSGGRAILGLGVSTPAVIADWHGVPMDRPLRRLRETTQAVRAIVRRDPAGWRGELVRAVPGMTLAFRPPREAIPIYHATLGPAAVRLTAELADGWLPTLLTPATLQRETAEIKERRRAAGRTEEFTVAALVPALVGDDVDAAGLLKRYLATQIGVAGPLYHGIIARQGYAAAADQIRSEWVAGRREAAASAVPEDLVDALALYGSTARCRAKLEEYAASGVDIVVLAPPAAAGHDASVRTIQALAPLARS